MTDGLWIASYVALWVLVIVLGIAVIALLRQIGVLHARLRPMGVHFGGEGLPRGVGAPYPRRFSFGTQPWTLLAFTSRDCDICRSLAPGLRALAREYDDVRLEVVEHDPSTREVFAAYEVRSTPYFVLVDRDGNIQGGGIANTLEQVEVLLDAANDSPEGSPDLARAREGSTDVA